MAEKRITYLAEDISTILDRSIIAVENEADKELIPNPIKRAGGYGRVVFIQSTKQQYHYNIDTSEWDLIQ